MPSPSTALNLQTHKIFLKFLCFISYLYGVSKLIIDCSKKIQLKVNVDNMNVFKILRRGLVSKSIRKSAFMQSESPNTAYTVAHTWYIISIDLLGTELGKTTDL